MQVKNCELLEVFLTVKRAFNQKKEGTPQNCRLPGVGPWTFVEKCRIQF